MTTRLFAVMAVVTCVFGLPAFAQEGYVGASYLNSNLTVDEFGFDGDSDGWKIFGGYTFNKYFGLEVAYNDFGSFDETITGYDDFGSPISAGLDLEVEALDLSLRGIIPLGERFELFGTLGYSHVDLKATATFSDEFGVYSGSASDDSWELMYGVGLSFKIGDKFGLRADYAEWDVDSLDAISLGAYYRFGQK